MTAIITAEHIRKALASAYQSPEWYIGFEVGNSTGANARRHADAVAINAYPSKGFEMRGFEIKVSKSDLKTELEIGIKSDEIARFCDYWFLVVPKGLADGFTLPPTWGVIEYADGKLRQKIKATKLDKEPITTGFMCAMLRGRERLLLADATRITAEREAELLRQADFSRGSYKRDLEELYAKLNKIKTATGIALDKWTPAQSIIDKLNAAQSLDIITHEMRSVERLAKAMLSSAQELQAAAAAMRKRNWRVTENE